MQNIFASTCHVNLKLNYVIPRGSLCLHTARVVTRNPRGGAGIIVCYFACSIRVDVPNFPRLDRVLLFNKYIYKPGQFGCAFTTTTKNDIAQCPSLSQTRTEDSPSPPPTPQTSESHLAPLSLAESSHSAHPYLIVTQRMSRPKWRRSVR